MTSTLGKLMFARERRPLHLKEALQTHTQLILSRQTNLQATSPIYKKDLTHRLNDTGFIQLTLSINKIADNAKCGFLELLPQTTFTGF